MIISASRRCDIPAFFPEWLAQRVQDGFCVVSNPYYPEKLYRIPINSDDTDAIVLWTKDIRPLMPYMDVLDESGIPYYIQHTLTPYDEDIEPGVYDKDSITSAMKQISERIGKERIIWRYDPIIFSDKYDENFHRRAFERIAGYFDGVVEQCVFSFVDANYKGAEKLHDMSIVQPTLQQRLDFASFMKATADRHDIEISTCAQDALFEQNGIKKARCIDPELIARISGKYVVPGKDKKDSSQRALCGCAPSTDIGTYGICQHGCAYCYAQADTAIPDDMAFKHMHHPKNPILWGQIPPDVDIDDIPWKKTSKSMFVFENDSGLFDI